ncbi:MAG: riboflavin synthase [Aquificae bacterium]|nr:riboflavin synthase [Aquificota bacterium]
MFTGLIEETGKIVSLDYLQDGLNLVVKAEKVIQDTKIGDSIAINGICLTVTEISDKKLSFDVSKETIQRTNLKTAKVGDFVNLERALKVSDRLGGHIVQGHIDTTVEIKNFYPYQKHWYLEIEIPSTYRDLVVEKGSIALDGISLTINYIENYTIQINIIPHTRENTNLKYRKTGDTLNVEFDIVGKYVKEIVYPYKQKRLKDLLDNF